MLLLILIPAAHQDNNTTNYRSDVTSLLLLILLIACWECASFVTGQSSAKSTTNPTLSAYLKYFISNDSRGSSCAWSCAWSCANNCECGVHSPSSCPSKVPEINIVTKLTKNNTRFHVVCEYYTLDKCKSIYFNSDIILVRHIFCIISWKLVAWLTTDDYWGFYFFASSPQHCWNPSLCYGEQHLIWFSW